MKLNERGASLVVVLMVVLVFSILGLSVMGRVVNENKQINVTEADVQARNLAENGITYFETDFKNDAGRIVSNADTLNSFLNNYKDFKEVGNSNQPDETRVKAELDGSGNIKVTSIGKVGSLEKTIIGYYKLGYDLDIEAPTYALADFNKDGTVAVDFTQAKVAGVNLLNILNLNLLNVKGSDQDFYPVPVDSALNVDLLSSLLGISLGDNFNTMEENRVIASREGQVLSLDLLKENQIATVSVNLLSYQDENDTNVMINGAVNSLTLLGQHFISGYKDIDFKKLAVMGNTIIQGSSDPNSNRRFTFAEGLYVNKSLIIGGSQAVSNLMLRGNMVTMQNLTLKNANVTIGDSNTNEASLKQEDYITNLYVHGDAVISNSTIQEKNSNYDFRLIAGGTITIDNKKANNVYNGLFYSKTGIVIKTNGLPMTIKGGIIGNYTVDYPDKLTVLTDPEYLQKVNWTNITLLPQGRTLQ